MNHRAVIALLSALGAPSCGVFSGAAAVRAGVTRKQLTALIACGALERVHPDVYRLTAVARSSEQSLRAALLWAGDTSGAFGRSAGWWYGLEGIRPAAPEVVLPRGGRLHARGVVVHRSDERDALMLRTVRGLTVTGPESTMLGLGHAIRGEALEVACEDARRRRLTSIPALRAYLDRFGAGKRGAATLRRLLDDLDPVHPARSTLEVKTRRLLVANGITDFVREFPLTWNGRTYRYDFGFLRRGVILETNGRRWHDDASDYEDDHEKWSVPGRLGYGIVFATWAKVARDPGALLADLTAALAA